MIIASNLSLLDLVVERFYQNLKIKLASFFSKIRTSSGKSIKDLDPL